MKLKISLPKPYILNRREAPSLQSNILSMIRGGETIEVDVNADNGFYRLSDGSGFVKADADHIQYIDVTSGESTGLVNKAGVVVSLGTGEGSTVYYCSRLLGRSVVSGSQGKCGPNSGPCCADCKYLKPVTLSPNSKVKSASSNPLQAPGTGGLVPFESLATSNSSPFVFGTPSVFGSGLVPKNSNIGGFSGFGTPPAFPSHSAPNGNPFGTLPNAFASSNNIVSSVFPPTSTPSPSFSTQFTFPPSVGDKTTEPLNFSTQSTIPELSEPQSLPKSSPFSMSFGEFVNIVVSYSLMITSQNSLGVVNSLRGYLDMLISEGICQAMDKDDKMISLFNSTSAPAVEEKLSKECASLERCNTDESNVNATEKLPSIPQQNENAGTDGTSEKADEFYVLKLTNKDYSDLLLQLMNAVASIAAVTDTTAEPSKDCGTVASGEKETGMKQPLIGFSGGKTTTTRGRARERGGRTASSPNTSRPVGVKSTTNPASTLGNPFGGNRNRVSPFGMEKGNNVDQVPQTSAIVSGQPSSGNAFGPGYFSTGSSEEVRGTNHVQVQPSAKIQHISSMLGFQNKSCEELRFEDIVLYYYSTRKHPHYLAPCDSNRGAQHKCDVCGNRGDIAFFCKDCDFDICHACVVAEKASSSSLSSSPTSPTKDVNEGGSGPRCNKSHQLTQSESMEGYTHGWECDQCNVLGNGTKRWVCVTCSYDLCFTCAPGLPTDVHTVSQSPQSPVPTHSSNDAVATKYDFVALEIPMCSLPSTESTSYVTDLVELTFKCIDGDNDGVFFVTDFLSRKQVDSDANMDIHSYYASKDISSSSSLSSSSLHSPSPSLLSSSLELVPTSFDSVQEGPSPLPSIARLDSNWTAVQEAFPKSVAQLSRSFVGLEQTKVQLDKMVTTACSIISEREHSVLSMLQCYEWNTRKLTEDYLDDPFGVRQRFGLPHPSMPTLLRLDVFGLGTTNINPSKETSEFKCTSCLDDSIDPTQAYALQCNHYFCKDCWIGYIKEKVSSKAVPMLCPEAKCPKMVTTEVMEFFCGEESRDGYIFNILTSFVQQQSRVSYCKNPVGCEGITWLGDDTIGGQAECRICLSTFCTNCDINICSHGPAPCHMLKLWEAKDGYLPRGTPEDMESRRLLASLAKPCPKCGIKCIKNGGCVTMTCPKESKGCGFQWCWFCGDKTHGHDSMCTRPKVIPAKGSVQEFDEKSKECQELFAKRDQALEVVNSFLMVQQHCTPAELKRVRSNSHLWSLLARAYTALGFTCIVQFYSSSPRIDFSYQCFKEQINSFDLQWQDNLNFEVHGANWVADLETRRVAYLLEHMLKEFILTVSTDIHGLWKPE